MVKTVHRRLLIDGGTICLNNKEAWSRDAAHIGKGAANSTRAQTDVTIAGGTIHLINAGAYIKSPMIYWLGTGCRWNTAEEYNQRWER